MFLVVDVRAKPSGEGQQAYSTAVSQRQRSLLRMWGRRNGGRRAHHAT